MLSSRDAVPARFGTERDDGLTALRRRHSAALFAICLPCHGEPYRRRPTDPAQLTEFYLWMSAGGAGGGPFVARVATNLFDEDHEWPATLVAALGLAALVGLGAGTLATDARETDRHDACEISPEAARIAERWFDNLPACPARERRMLVGDARLKMSQQPAGLEYDVIVLDAFTGGSVPTWPLTREAFATWRPHFSDDRFISINITTPIRA